MPGNGDQPPTEQALRRLLDVVAPGTRPVGVHPLAASYSNHNHLIDVEGPDGHRDRLVTRRYADGGEPPARKAVREYRTLELLREHPEVPTPEPLLLDVDGMLLGSPGIVTRFVAGELVPAHPQSTRWAQLCVKAARVLANIHAVPIDLGRDEYLMDAATEAVWFLGDGPPDYMRAHPDGAAVWQAVGDLRHDLAPVPPTLVHVDFWSGNIVWDGDNVNAVVDWEEAGYGDPAIDVAVLPDGARPRGQGRCRCPVRRRVREPGRTDGGQSRLLEIGRRGPTDDRHRRVDHPALDGTVFPSLHRPSLERGRTVAMMGG